MTTEIPGNHEIRQVWADNEKLRTIDGTIEMANAGDRQAIKILMGSFVMKVENGRRPPPELMNWIAQAFVCIINKDESADANEAFRLSRSAKGRPPIDSEGREQRARVAAFIIGSSSPDDRGSIGAAVEAAAKKFLISERRARQIYYAYRLN